MAVPRRVGYRDCMKANHFVRGPGRAPKPATQQQIAALAHELWLARGCPSGSDLDIWLEAERQLNGQVAPLDKLPLHRDPIPADPAHPTPDEDPALKNETERQIEETLPRREPRSPTSGVI
jgi:hypothetical protein